MESSLKTFGILNGPLPNVLAVARKRIPNSNPGMLTTWGWWVLVSSDDGYYSHWFTTKRPFDKREPEDHYVGEKTNISKQRKATTPDEWEYDADKKGYTQIEDPEYWPIQAQAHPDLVCANYNE